MLRKKHLSEENIWISRARTAHLLKGFVDFLEDLIQILLHMSWDALNTLTALILHRMLYFDSTDCAQDVKLCSQINSGRADMGFKQTMQLKFV